MPVGQLDKIYLLGEKHGKLKTFAGSEVVQLISKGEKSVVLYPTIYLG